MTSPGHPSADALRRVLQQIETGLRLVASRPLTGGVSAQVTAIEAELPNGGQQRLVLRQYGAANLRADPHVAAHEYQLLTLLRASGQPVPTPYHADESGTILPVPWLAVEFIGGVAVTRPPVPPGFTSQLAAALARLHASAFTRADAPYLADLAGIATRRIETWPARLDEPLNEAAVRTAIARCWPPPQVNMPILLHGDYWPGNTMWRDGEFVGVIDWEDAVIGDPLADVGNARMELAMLFGADVATDFTRQYRVRMPGMDLTALAYWDLYAALRHAGRMGEWGLSDSDLARLQDGHRKFTAAALAVSQRLAR